MKQNNISIFKIITILLIAFIINLTVITTLLFPGTITVEKTNVVEKAVLSGTTNVSVMAFKIIDSASHSITNIKIKNLGDMSNSTDVSGFKLWYDANKNGTWDLGDEFITNAVWNAGNNSWDFVGLGAIGNSGAIDLSGWHLNEEINSYTIPGGTILPPDKYLIISLNSDQGSFETYYGVTMPPGCLFLNSGNMLPDWDGIMDEFYIIDDNLITQDGPTAVFGTFPFDILNDFSFPDQYNVDHTNNLGMFTGDCDPTTTSFVDASNCTPVCKLRIDWAGITPPVVPGCWQSTLSNMGFGMDLSGATNISILICGDVGGEEVDICLEDAMLGSACVPSGPLPAGPLPIELSIPLSAFFGSVGRSVLAYTRPNPPWSVGQ